MNSRDFYRILHGWDVENYLTEGLKYCAIFIKNTESLSDDLLVQYSNGIKRRVAGMFLFTNLDDAVEWMQKRKQAEIDVIDNQIYQLNAEKEKIYQSYANISIEESAV